TVPPPPGRFSTTTDWPSASPILSATARATIEVLPPGANETTSVIGRLGKGCADAGRARTNAQVMRSRRSIGSLHRLAFPEGYWCASAMIREGGGAREAWMKSLNRPHAEERSLQRAQPVCICLQCERVSKHVAAPSFETRTFGALLRMGLAFVLGLLA